MTGSAKSIISVPLTDLTTNVVCCSKGTVILLLSSEGKVYSDSSPTGSTKEAVDKWEFLNNGKTKYFENHPVEILRMLSPSHVEVSYLCESSRFVVDYANLTEECYALGSWVCDDHDDSFMGQLYEVIGHDRDFMWLRHEDGKTYLTVSVNHAHPRFRPCLAPSGKKDDE